MSHAAPISLPVEQRRLDWLHSDFVAPIHEVVEIQEQEDEGRGRVKFTLSDAGLQLRIHSHGARCLNWFFTDRTADGVFIVFKNGVAHLHIVELKRTLSRKKWCERVRFQFDGTRLSAMAAQHILGINEFASVTVYAVYQEDRLSAGVSSKPMVGTSEYDPLHGWVTEEVRLCTGEKARLVKIPCIIDGDEFSGSINL